MSGLLVLVDSCFYISLLRKRQDPFEILTHFEFDYEFAVEGVVWSEVVRGLSEPAVRQRFEDRFESMTFLGLSPAGHRRAADLAWHLDRSGRVLPLTDILIAATALEHDAMVLTFDRHFSHIPGISVYSDLH